MGFAHLAAYDLHPCHMLSHAVVFITQFKTFFPTSCELLGGEGDFLNDVLFLVPGSLSCRHSILLLPPHFLLPPCFRLLLSSLSVCYADPRTLITASRCGRTVHQEDHPVYVPKQSTIMPRNVTLGRPRCYLILVRKNCKLVCRDRRFAREKAAHGSRSWEDAAAGIREHLQG